MKWQREPGVKAAWISLDEVDNAENRFLRYLLAALDRADDREDDYWEDLRNLLQSSQTTPFDSILPSLINRIAAYEGDLLLVLEDYHLIKTESIHDALSSCWKMHRPNFTFCSSRARIRHCRCRVCVSGIN